MGFKQHAKHGNGNSSGQGNSQKRKWELSTTVMVNGEVVRVRKSELEALHTPKVTTDWLGRPIKVEKPRGTVATAAQPPRNIDEQMKAFFAEKGCPIQEPTPVEGCDVRREERRLQPSGISYDRETERRQHRIQELLELCSEFGKTMNGTGMIVLGIEEYMLFLGARSEWEKKYMMGETEEAVDIVMLANMKKIIEAQKRVVVKGDVLILDGKAIINNCIFDADSPQYDAIVEENRRILKIRDAEFETCILCQRFLNGGFGTKHPLLAEHVQNALRAWNGSGKLLDNETVEKMKQIMDGQGQKPHSNQDNGTGAKKPTFEDEMLEFRLEMAKEMLGSGRIRDDPKLSESLAAFVRTHDASLVDWADAQRTHDRIRGVCSSFW